MEEWRRLPQPGQHVGVIGKPTAALWEWTLTYRLEQPPTKQSADTSWDSQGPSEKDSLAEAVMSELAQYVQLSRPLAR